MVPSDLRFSAPASRHARPGQRGREVRGNCFRHSPPQLLAAADRRFERCRTTPLTRPTPRNGHSLPDSGCPFPDHLCRIVVPGLPLRRPTGLVPGPFGPGFPSSIGEDRYPETRCRFLARHSQRLPAPCSPPEPFDSSGSTLVAVHRRKACLSRTPGARHSLSVEV
jgi:hypothetical protein